MSMYILAENKEKPALECINESKSLTYGYKMDLFVLSLSFIGWILLSVITFGIALIWILPYMNATFANAYLYLKEERASLSNQPDIIFFTEDSEGNNTGIPHFDSVEETPTKPEESAVEKEETSEE